MEYKVVDQCRVLGGRVGRWRRSILFDVAAACYVQEIGCFYVLKCIVYLIS